MFERFVGRTIPRRVALISGVVALAGCTPRNGPSPTPATPRATGPAVRLEDELAAAANAGQVSLKAGTTYLVSAPADVSGLRIDGQGAVIRPSPDFTGTTLLTASTPCTLSDLSIEGQASGVSGTFDGLTLTGQAANESTLTGLTFSSLPRDGLVANGGAGPSTGRATWTSLTFTGCERGFLISQCEDLKLTGCVANRCERLGGQVVRSANVSMDNCGFNGTRDRSRAGDGLVILYSSSVHLRQCEANDNARRGFSFGGGDPQWPANTDLLLDRSRARSNGDHGVTVDPTIKGEEGVSVPTSGRIRQGEYSGNGANGINLTSVQDLVLVDNACYDNGKNGIAVAGSGIVLNNNRSGRNGKYGIALYGNTLDSGHGPYRLRANSSSDDKSGGLFIGPNLGGNRVHLVDNNFS